MFDIPIRVAPKSLRFIDQLCVFIRARNLSDSTEKTYIRWVLKLIRFHNKSFPLNMQSIHKAQTSLAFTLLSINALTSLTEASYSHATESFSGCLFRELLFAIEKKLQRLHQEHAFLYSAVNQYNLPKI